MQAVVIAIIVIVVVIVIAVIIVVVVIVVNVVMVVVTIVVIADPPRVTIAIADTIPIPDRSPWSAHCREGNGHGHPLPKGG